MGPTLLLLVFLCLPHGSVQGPHEKRLLHMLLDHYNVLERPVANESDPLQLSFGLTLMQIIDVDEKNQMLTTNAWLNLDEKNQLLITNIWLKLEWNDVNLRWNSSEFGGVKDLRIPPHRIWKPDVLMYNRSDFSRKDTIAYKAKAVSANADEGFDGTYPTNVVVRNNGSCLYVPPGIFKSTCKIDITWFPFDDQRCEMKFGSWTYDGFQLDLQLQDDTGGDISSFITNGEWDLLGVPGKRNEIYYNCCPEPYIDITFIIIIRRRTLYYFFNLIVPCVLIASMAVLGFTLPPDSGEKLSLGMPGEKNVKEYACCPEPYVDITFVVHIRRRTLFYTVNLIVPCVMISSMTLLGFTLPHECGEKLTLGVTILLSLTVFLNMVAETMPATSDAVPLLAHSRPCACETEGCLPFYKLKKIDFWDRCNPFNAADVTVLLSLTFFLNMVAETMPPTSERPLIGVTILLSLTVFHNLVAETLPQVSDAMPVLGTYFNCIMFMVASSVVSTILILNYHHRNADTHNMSTWIKLVFLQWLPWILRMSRPGQQDSRKSVQMRELELKERSSKSLLANVLDIDDDFRHGGALQPSGAAAAAAAAAAGFIRVTGGSGGAGQPGGAPTGPVVGHHHHPEDSPSGLAAHNCLGPHRELSLILKELRVLTDKLRKEDEAAEVTNDWKFAAMVVDRLCLIIFTLFTIIATIAVLFSAPHIIVT